MHAAELLQQITRIPGPAEADAALAAATAAATAAAGQPAATAAATAAAPPLIGVTVVDTRFLRPIDIDLLLSLAASHECLLFVEEGAQGGFGSMATQTLLQHGALDSGNLIVSHFSLFLASLSIYIYICIYVYVRV